MGTGRITDPTDRESFKKFIRAKLGEPVIQINVSEFQVDIAVDEALQYFRDYHYNGTEHAYYIHHLTQQDIDNRYFTVPDELIGVTTFYSITDAVNFDVTFGPLTNSWQVNYGLAFSQGVLNGVLLTYYINRMYYEMLQQILIGRPAFRFNMHTNRVYLDSSISKLNVGDNIVLDGWMVTDPDVNPDVWSDRWLIRYATAKLKHQWGENISKFGGMMLPGGVQLNGERILREADDEIRNIEENCLRDYSEPPRDWLA